MEMVAFRKPIRPAQREDQTDRADQAQAVRQPSAGRRTIHQRAPPNKNTGGGTGQKQPKGKKRGELHGKKSADFAAVIEQFLREQGDQRGEEKPGGQRPTRRELHSWRRGPGNRGTGFTG